MEKVVTLLTSYFTRRNFHGQNWRNTKCVTYSWNRRLSNPTLRFSKLFPHFHLVINSAVFRTGKGQFSGRRRRCKRIIGYTQCTHLALINSKILKPNFSNRERELHSFRETEEFQRSKLPTSAWIKEDSRKTSTFLLS